MSNQQSSSNPMANPTFVILEPEGLYADTKLEQTILSTSINQRRFEIHQAHLGEDIPYSHIPLELRQRVNGLFVLRHWVKEEDITLFENLKVIVRMGVGYDRLDRVALEKRGVIVCNCPGKPLHPTNNAFNDFCPHPV
jgi:C-terminal binding protein